jgi:hypothetical protein
MRKTQEKVAGALPVIGSAWRSRKRHEGGTADDGDTTRFAVEPLGAFFGMARKASGRTWTFTG